ncbi:MAG: TrkH family potassium uptake protein [Bacteroidales bacterium]|nr:TrkH family potassium uptake protein [Bacteroidales bacterium]
MDSRIITWYIGVSLLLAAGLMLVSGLLTFLTPGDESRIPLLFSAFITGTVGFFPLIFVRRKKKRLTVKEGNGIMVGSWLACCLFGMLPFLMYGREFTFTNALFESVSGFTTTGASILTDIEALPAGLQFWRISTAWVGGIGIVTLFSMVMRGGMDKATLASTEISSATKEQFRGAQEGFFGSKMLVVYLALTVATAISLMLTGMNGFDAITNAMSACSTCGFCIRNASIAFYDNPAAEMVLTLAMLASGLNFSLIFLSFVKGSGRNLWKSETARWFVIMVVAAVCIVTVSLVARGGVTLGKALRDSAFQVVSLSTTTGFATSDTTLWPPLAIAVLLACSLVCGCSGSTSGGMKFDRALLAFKSLRSTVKASDSLGSINVVHLDGQPRNDKQIKDTFIFMICYMAIILLFAIVNSAGGLDTLTAFTASVACMGNVGPGFGEVGSMSNYAAFPALLKYTSMVEMLLGRLEIFPMLYLLRNIFR